MVVSQNHRRGVVLERGLDDFTRIHGCAVNGSVEQEFMREVAIVVVEKDHHKRFTLQVTE